MNKLIKEVLKYQKTKEDEIFNNIINEFEKVINYNVIKMPKNYREDLRQEILMAIFIAIPKFKVNKNLLDDTINDLEILEIYYEIIKNKYYDLFIDKFHIVKIDVNNVKTLKNLINEFYNFCNENQFRKYINVISNNKTIDFYRKYKIALEKEKISLNIVYDNNEEYIDKIIDEKKQNNRESNYVSINEKDVQFLKLFYDDNKKLTEREVAKKIGVTQQAVSKRLKRIINKYNLNFM